ncbi:hypothetical protein KUF71_012741 [Frankliniella fusca]|uniref:Uncharacterized protein n=1 Tax=Frankliniella fusca TaxID=407009 RepID=A0AAE1HNV9_9NEOP|nr:hypothetical protein KUF71_012741 [Frankliniella fusca]
MLYENDVRHVGRGKAKKRRKVRRRDDKTRHEQDGHETDAEVATMTTKCKLRVEKRTAPARRTRGSFSRNRREVRNDSQSGARTQTTARLALGRTEAAG